ncbi:MAG: polymer-forming cytoskeletal protein [Candidatus Omnitrophica bacterium]|nr:polymer-forming cytoskeletal protein [Candidatus Omnitrophota bacterium]
MAKKQEEPQEKILDVDASMQGTITFKDPVNLRINGSFEGKLDTRGVLAVGENAKVKANITGDKIIISGKVSGNITAFSSLTLTGHAVVSGQLQTPVLSILEGAVLDGEVQMSAGEQEVSEDMSLGDVANFLELEEHVVEEWAAKKKIPAVFQSGSWHVRRSELERWIQEERINS